jgi:hypothetical protein
MSGLIGGAGSKSGVIGTTELDYETGTFTPTATSLSSSAGRYTKIGRIVTCWWYSRNNQLTPSRTDYAGLPFTAVAGGTGQFTSGVACAYAGNMGGQMVARIPDGTSEVDFTDTQTTTKDLTNAWLELEFCITYEVA